MLCLNYLTSGRCPLGPLLLPERPKSTFRNGWGKFCSIVPKFVVADVEILRISDVGSDRYANSATTSAHLQTLFPFFFPEKQYPDSSKTGSKSGDDSGSPPKSILKKNRRSTKRKIHYDPTQRRPSREIEIYGMGAKSLLLQSRF